MNAPKPKLTAAQIAAFEQQMHIFWTACVGQTYYDKNAWNNVQRQLMYLQRDLLPKDRNEMP